MGTCLPALCEPDTSIYPFHIDRARSEEAMPLRGEMLLILSLNPLSVFSRLKLVPGRVEIDLLNEKLAWNVKRFSNPGERKRG